MNTFITKLKKLFLLPVAKGFECLSIVYHKVWDLGWCTPEKSPIPVVSIGNLAIGGVGKTPMTLFLALELTKRNILFAIASRGYRSEWENSPIAKRVDPLITTAAMCGDEPLLLARKCPKTSVWITKNRIKSAQSAAKEGSKLLLLDDGMQHRKIVKDFEIVLLNAKEPFGPKIFGPESKAGAFFPLGVLRDHPRRLKNASLIVLMNCQERSSYESAKKQVEQFTKSPIVGFGGKIIPSKYKKVAVLTAIANPKRFLDMLKESGIEIVLVLSLRDHSFFKVEILEDFAIKAKKAGAESIVCTEKDHVKIETPLKSALPITPVPLEIFPIYDKDHWDRALEQIIRLV